MNNQIKQLITSSPWAKIKRTQLEEDETHKPTSETTDPEPENTRDQITKKPPTRGKEEIKESSGASKLIQPDLKKHQKQIWKRKRTQNSPKQRNQEGKQTNLEMKTQTQTCNLPDLACQRSCTRMQLSSRDEAGPDDATAHPSPHSNCLLPQLPDSTHIDFAYAAQPLQYIRRTPRTCYLPRNPLCRGH